MQSNHFEQLRLGILKKGNLDLNKIERAYWFAAKVHQEQKRKSGEPYIIHPVEVARVVYEIGGNEDMICAAFLHDTLEDGKNPEIIAQEIYRSFGDYVYFLVQALSKDGKIEDKEMQQASFFEQIQEAFEMDMAVFFLKMADLIHNFETISFLKPAKQNKWIEELKDQYYPIFVHRYHEIPQHYRGMYCRFMEKLENLIKE